MKTILNYLGILAGGLLYALELALFIITGVVVSPIVIVTAAIQLAKLRRSIRDARGPEAEQLAVLAEIQNHLSQLFKRPSEEN